MTFKHSRFDESEIMRSFQKTALEKGLISPDQMKKETSVQKEADLSPSGNLLQNIVKLCSGLQKAGLDHFSRDLENAFFTFKTAESNLYHTQKETGEDLLETAHPEGSHTMEGILGDAVVEDLIEQHMKMLKMVEKKPSGKLSSAHDVIRAVKLVLAEDDAVVNSLRSLLSSLSLINYSYQKISSTFSNPLTWLGPAGLIGAGIKEFIKPESPEKLIRKVQGFLNIGTISTEQANKLKMDVNHLASSYRPAYLNLTGLDKETFEEMSVYFDRANLALDNLIRATSTSTPKPVGSVQSIKAMEGFQETRDFTRAKNDALRTLDKIESAVESNNNQENAKYKPSMKEWADKVRQRINALPPKLQSELKSEEFSDPERRKAIVQDYMDTLTRETSKFKEVLDGWSK